jgi:nicotinamide-nucleotide amidase
MPGAPAGAEPATLAGAVLAALEARGETLAVAESLTGGLLAATIVDVPGASRVFRGGLVVYATDLKASLAGVPAELLDEHGPVHPAVAGELATGARRRCGAHWGLGTTGVAGPDPQNGVAVGTVFVAVSSAGGENVRALQLSGPRPTIRAGAVNAALELLRAALTDVGVAVGE